MGAFEPLPDEFGGAYVAMQLANETTRSAVLPQSKPSGAWQCFTLPVSAAAERASL